MARLPELAVISGQELIDILYEKIPECFLASMDIGETLKTLPAFMSQRTAARAIDVSPSTMSRMVKDKRIPVSFVNGQPRISKEDLFKYLIQDTKPVY